MIQNKCDLDAQMITVHDDVFSIEQNMMLYDILLYKSKFTYGEWDRQDLPSTGMLCELTDKQTFDMFYKKLIELYPNLVNKHMHRAYVNLFKPNENPYYHYDGKDMTTYLFYINPEYDVDENGETLFKIGNEIIGVAAKPARLVVFDGMISHRATSFRSKPRITVAIKFFNGERY
jgi:hypothetical protein